MLVMQPGQGTMQVAPMPAFNRTFTTYTLDLENAARIGAPQTRR
jgi:isopenicillin-N N-acyltransferase-like protein